VIPAVFFRAQVRAVAWPVDHLEVLLHQEHLYVLWRVARRAVLQKVGATMGTRVQRFLTLGVIYPSLETCGPIHA
jgi:hypothetical protein